MLLFRVASAAAAPSSDLRARLDESEAQVRDLQRQQRQLVERVRAEAAEKATAESQIRKYRE